jgi:hypothetical protein
MPERKPWERREDETAEAFEGFVIYRDGGAARSLANVRRELGKSRTLIEKWSREHAWVSRALAHDDEQDRIRREAAAREIETMSRRHAQQLEAAMIVLGRPGMELAKRINDRALDLSTMKPDELFALTRDAARTLPALVTAERLVRGVSTSNLGGHDGGPINDSTQGEIEAFLLGFKDGSEQLLGELEDGHRNGNG